MGQRRPRSPDRLTLTDLRWARETFERAEPRNLFYRLATMVMDLGEVPGAAFSRAEGLAVLLQTWNEGYYRRLRHQFDAAHFAAIERLLSEFEPELAVCRGRSIETLEAANETTSRQLFHTFEGVLGQTGAAKALHLLAPRFFPLWDAAIAVQAYGLYRRDDIDYWQLMRSTHRQVVGFGGEAALGRNALKAIDEYNYCRYTLGRVPPGPSTVG